MQVINYMIIYVGYYNSTEDLLSVKVTGHTVPQG